MTEQPPDAKISQAFVKRPVTSFRIREDFIAKVDAECKRLKCSKGVYFETLLIKAWETGLINSEDVGRYDAELRWLAERMLREGVS